MNNRLCPNSCKCSEDINCPKLLKSDHIGFIVDPLIPINRLNTILTQWTKKYNINLANHKISYNAMTRDFSQRYGLDFELDKYFSSLGKNVRNFWIDPTADQFIVDFKFNYDLYKNLIDYVSSRRGLLLFIRHDLNQEWFINLFNYAVSLDLSIVFDLAYDA